MKSEPRGGWDEWVKCEMDGGEKKEGRERKRCQTVWEKVRERERRSEGEEMK